MIEQCIVKNIANSIQKHGSSSSNQGTSSSGSSSFTGSASFNSASLPTNDSMDGGSSLVDNPFNPNNSGPDADQPIDMSPDKYDDFDPKKYLEKLGQIMHRIQSEVESQGFLNFL